MADKPSGLQQLLNLAPSALRSLSAWVSEAA